MQNDIFQVFILAKVLENNTFSANVVARRPPKAALSIRDYDCNKRSILHACDEDLIGRIDKTKGIDEVDGIDYAKGIGYAKGIDYAKGI